MYLDASTLRRLSSVTVAADGVGGESHKAWNSRHRGLRRSPGTGVEARRERIVHAMTHRPRSFLRTLTVAWTVSGAVEDLIKTGLGSLEDGRWTFRGPDPLTEASAVVTHARGAKEPASPSQYPRFQNPHRPGHRPGSDGKAHGSGLASVLRLTALRVVPSGVVSIWGSTGCPREGGCRRLSARGSARDETRRPQGPPAADARRSSDSTWYDAAIGA